jgi:RimJ/RimL family protein N-acetyltransferase
MFVRTPQLLLRPGWPDDAAELARAVHEDKAPPWPVGLGPPDEFLGAELSPADSRLLMFRRRRNGPLLVGAARLSGRPGGDEELGFWFSRSRASLGLAGEALRALVDSARLSLRAKRLLFIQASEPGTVALLRKLGFERSEAPVVPALVASGRMWRWILTNRKAGRRS